MRNLSPDGERIRKFCSVLQQIGLLGSRGTVVNKAGCTTSIT